MADVPIAFLLSGGLDSSLICSIIKRLYKHKEIHTFSIGIKGSPDLLAAQKVADFLQTTHHSYILNYFRFEFTVEEALDVLKDVIYHIESFE